MKLNSFKIVNYKSILDSNICYVNSELTIFAGKNESGKTNILTALQHLSTGKFSEQDYPLRKTNYKPHVLFEFILDKKDYESLDNSLNGLLKTYKIKDENFSFMLDDMGNIILENGNIINKLKEKIYNNFQSKLVALNKKLKKHNIEQDVENSQDLQRCSNEIQSLEIENKDEIIELIDESIQCIEIISDELVANAIQIIVPNIIYFNSFKDNLPDVITKDCLDLSNNYFTIVNRLFKYLNIDKDKIFLDIKSEEDERRRSDYISSLEKIISDDLFVKYTQMPVRLKFRMSSLGGLNIDIYDADSQGFIHQGDIAYKISDRSEGFRWFLSFYVTLKGENFSENDIVLIDEPGLYLHASAQQDMLKVFLEESKNHQIIFTTHSPYLIDVNNLSRIRLVEKFQNRLENINFEETKIISSILKGSDNETITPIADAIGYNLNEGLTINYDSMSIVEGPSDYYYIIKMASILGIELKCGIIPSGGAPKIGNICAVLFGFKVDNIKCIYDNDDAGNVARNQNLENFGFENIQHILLSKNKNYQIEDLFSIEDFAKHICENPKNLKNSKLVEKKNKTLLAKIFNDKNLSKSDFAEETINNFTNLICKLNGESDQ